MAKDRVVSAGSQAPDEQPAVASLRPQDLDSYIGQRDLVEKLRIALQAVRERGEPMEHVLLYGPPGLGKTTLAHVIANEMGTHAYVTSGPALTKGADLVGTLTKMQPGDVLFIDEIHRLPIAVEEYVYPAMEDFKIDFSLDSGLNSKVITYQLKPFTLLGATTRPGLLTAALRSRFGIRHHLRFYDQPDLVEILDRACRRLGMPPVAGASLSVIAIRSRGTPRVALRLLRRIRDFAQVRAGGRIEPDVIDQALALEGVDELGLDELDRRYLRTIATVYRGGPVGLEAIAASLGEDSGTLEDLVEPYLLQIGFLARTRQGRQLSPLAREHLNLPPAEAVAEDPAALFE
ncbi:MAG: Holliday junction branch migration DNA helicase RuvB [Planctomycetota bacterium]|jgi:Holliday junction DNA helicase RuvB